MHADPIPPVPEESDSRSSSSEDDTPMATARAMKKRKRSAAAAGKEEAKTSKVKKASSNGPTKFTAADARAAHWLLNLSVRDSQLAASASTVFGRQKQEENTS